MTLIRKDNTLFVVVQEYDDFYIAYHINGGDYETVEKRETELPVWRQIPETAAEDYKRPRPDLY